MPVPTANRETNAAGPVVRAAPGARGWLRWGFVAALALAVGGAYHNSFSGAFVFDDAGSIAENPTLRRLATAFVPPADSGLTVAGRPLLNASLALNRALTGDAPAGFHAVNLAIHFAAALLLAAFVRTALCAPRWRARTGAAADGIAAAAALVWAVHPLLTESVTYVVQRAESLAGLWVLLALWASARGAESARSGRWWALSFAATLAGVATKEVAVVVPVLAFLYDGVFVADGWRDAWRRRWHVYGLLALTWLPLAGFVAHAGNRGGTAGVGANVALDPWSYLLTQTKAVWLYLKLAAWPAPLVLDRGTPLWPLAQVWPFALATLALFAATARAVVRRHPLGFAGAWFFVLLAPSSSFVPVATQTLAEHRMYLPLAAVVVTVVGLAWPRLGRARWAVVAVATVAGACGAARRNADYVSAENLWRDTIAKAPDNPRAWSGLGTLLLDAGRAEEALEFLARGAALVPDNARYRLAHARGLAGVRRWDDAEREFAETLRLAPALYEAHMSWGDARVKAGRPADAVERFARGAELRPELPEAHFNLANALWWSGRAAEALPHYERALALEPGAIDVRTNFAAALAAAGRPDVALAEAETVLARDANVAPAHYVVAQVRLGRNDAAGAEAALRETLRLDPQHRDALWALAQLELSAERPGDALARFSVLLALEPSAAAVHNAAGIALAQLGRLREARDAFARAVALAPDFTDARENLRRARRELGE